jgi:glycosyltransferase involved in cell wall biosynthesis
MKVAILGTRGIPNHYGGFEQFAEYLSAGLVKLGHQVYVYNSHNHPCQLKVWKGVNIIHKYDPENRIGTAGQFIYDLNCIHDSRHRNFDIILQLGYTSSSVWGRWLPRQSVIITNMDGLEWKRTKYSRPVQFFLKYAEKLGVKYSHFLIADSLGIQRYLKGKYGLQARYIPYGATLFRKPSLDFIKPYVSTPYSYDMLIARLEPENSLEIILKGVAASRTIRTFLVIGNHISPYGSYLKNKYEGKKIKFLGTIYDMDILNNLRYFSNLYLHGHTVGGTNPSLLEAMASSALVVAHNNEFNNSILGSDAFYFTDSCQVQAIIETVQRNTPEAGAKIDSNIQKINNLYSWDKIIKEYEQMMLNCISKSSKKLALTEDL